MSAFWRQSLLAYLLLLGITVGFLSRVIQPGYSNWQAIQQQSDELRRAIDAHTATHAAVRVQNTQVQKALKAMVEQGELLAASPNQAAHSWQAAIKAMLRDAGVNLTALTPSQEQLGLEAAVLRLDLSFLTEAAALESLLAGFTQAPTKARIDLLSMRVANSQTSSARVAPPMLEGRLVVSTLSANVYANASLAPDSRDIPIPVKPTRPNRLSGLFDPATRLKFLTPQVAHYRVAAITVTEQSRMAVVIDSLSERTYRVQVGDFIDAWRVQAIERDRIRVQAGDSLAEMRLQN